jgi:WD40 repeat protein
MSRIFLSHSSANNAEAIALLDWLKREGWEDVFLDLDPERGIAAGERWERALSQAAHRCEAVLFLVSRIWLGSDWCLKEFNLALRLNKRLFGVLIEDLPISELPVNLAGTWQLVRLSSGRDHIMLRAIMPITGEEAHVTFSREGLARLKGGLRRAGLDPRFFAWPPESDPERPPYRGLLPLEAEDAGIFFGRDAPIIEALDRLRGLRDAAAPRLLVILGASGAGKSSFLRAGLLPRLERDDRNFLPLPVLRPERASISGEAGFLRSIELAFSGRDVPRTRAEIRATIEGGISNLGPLLTSLVAGPRISNLSDDPAVKAPIVVLPIDQGEELFLTEGGDEAERMLVLLRDLLMADAPNVLVLITMRSDSYDRLQTAKALEDIHQQTLSLPPLPRGAYQAVIEGPAERLRDSQRPLRIEPQLTQALLADIEAGSGRDALPLLAFTLERLYLEYGRLTLADYDALGRIRGSIEAAVERALRAADADPKIPRDRAARLLLLRHGLIPWLASIDNETNSPRRRIARISEIPIESRPLIQQLVEQRLLSTDAARDTGEVVIEPAHEALLRQWGLLQGWLKEDFRALTTLEGVKSAARDWIANDRKAAWLVHSGGRLEEAEQIKIRDDLARHITPVERDYLVQCRDRENSERKSEQLRLARERKNLRRVRWALAAFFVVVMAALGGALWQSYQTSKREAAVFASEAEAAFRAGLCDRALRMAMAALPPAKGGAILTFRSIELENALSRYASAPECPFRLALTGHRLAVLNAAFSPDGRHAVSASADNTARLWDVTTGATLATLSGHNGPVNSVAFSSDGSRVVTASDDNTARIWDANSGAALATLTGHRGPVNWAVFSPDGNRILTTSNDYTARLWDVETGGFLIALSGHWRRVRFAAFSPDGTRIVTAANDNTARLWDAKTGATLATLVGHKDWVRTAAFSPDGARIVTASEDKTARLWEGVTGVALATLSGHTGYVVSAAFSPDGNRVVTASWDKTARLWDATTGAALVTLSGHEGRLNSVTFSPDGKRVVTASFDKTARLWDAMTGAPLAKLAGHDDAVRTAAFSPDGSRIISSSLDKTARVWDATTSVTLATLSGHGDAVRKAVFSPDGSRVVTASFDYAGRLWDATTGVALATLLGHGYWLRGVVFSPDGTRIVTASFDNTARLWDGKTGAPLAILAHENWVRAAAFSPDGSQVITASDDKTARLWDSKTGAAILTLSGHRDRVYDAAFSPDGTRIATAGYDGARLWDAKTGAELATLSAHTGRVNNVAFNPQGTRIVTSSEDNTARLWDGKTGAARATLVGHDEPVYCAKFSPDGSRIITASFDNTARLWDGETGRALATLLGHGGPVNSAAFSPDGSRIVTASFDNTARLWDAMTGAPLVTLSGHGGPVNNAEFNGDGSRVVTSSDDRTARLWDVKAARNWQLDSINLILPTERQTYICRERLVGVQAFTDVEMRDPVLRGRDDLQNPCRRVGPFSLDYYLRAMRGLWPPQRTE